MDRRAIIVARGGGVMDVMLAVLIAAGDRAIAIATRAFTDQMLHDHRVTYGHELATDVAHREGEAAGLTASAVEFHQSAPLDPSP
jgi:hypothetical protein